MVDGKLENLDQPCYNHTSGLPSYGADLGQAAPGVVRYDLLTVALFDDKDKRDIRYIYLTTCWSIVISSMKNNIAPGQYMWAVFQHGDEVTRCKGSGKEV